MKVDILTREYPPHVYGGAGVHAEELSKVLAERIDVTVRAFDGKRTEADIPAIPNAADAKGSLKVVGYDEQGGCGVQRHHHGRLRYPGTRRSGLEGVRALPHRPFEAHPAVRGPYHPPEGPAIPAQGTAPDFQGHSGGAVRGSA